MHAVQLDKSAADVGERRLYFRVEGMHCGGCVAHVQRELCEVAGVRGVQVDLAAQRAVVTASVRVSGAELVARITDSGFEAHELDPTEVLDFQQAEQEHHQRLRQYRQAIILSVFMYGLPVLALELLGPVLDSSLPGAEVWWRALQAVLCTLALYSAAGAPILVSGVRAVLYRIPNMDLLISLGLVAAYVGGLVSLILLHGEHTHFSAIVMILSFINVGRYLEAKARRGVARSISALVDRAPKRAQRLVDGQVEDVDVDQVRMGDRLRVSAEMRVPVDGTVVSGAGAIDESLLTGESLPKDKKAGDEVLAGTMVQSGLLIIEATRLGALTVFGEIVEAVRQAQNSRTRLQRLADRVAGILVPGVVLIAVATCGAWVLVGAQRGGGFSTGFEAALAVLIIACPCALGLATPTAVYVSTTTAALDGILVRDAAALEALGQVSTVVFDKTGTLTSGRAHVARVVDEPLGPAARDNQDLIRLAAAVEQHSQHPLARAIVARAAKEGLTVPPVTDFQSEAGLGTRGTLDDNTIVRVGSRPYLQANGVNTQLMESRYEQLSADGQTVVWVARDNEIAGLIGLADRPREQASRAIEALKNLGLRTIMVTGDQVEAAASVAGAVGIDEVFAGIVPVGKAEVVADLQRERQIVAFVGDGVNDAPAISRADVGMTFASGTDVANQAADITLVGSDLRLVPSAVRIGRRSVHIIKQNLFWAFFYNSLAIPLAALAIIPAWIAPAAMMCSSLTVVLNALRLKS